MTTAPSSTGFQRQVRHEPLSPTVCLRLRWSVAPAALGSPRRAPLTLELELPTAEPARVTLEGDLYAPATDWAKAWDGTLRIHRVASGPGRGLTIVQATPLAVAVLGVGDAARPLHLACDLPAVLRLAGGRYELIAGELTL